MSSRPRYGEHRDVVFSFAGRGQQTKAGSPAFGGKGYKKKILSSPYASAVNKEPLKYYGKGSNFGRCSG